MLYLRIALLAPGIMLHEASHHLFCLLGGVKVRKVVYFRMGSPAGFVIHDEPELYRQLFAIVAGPVFLNSAAAVVLLNLALRNGAAATAASDLLAVFLLTWLGISAALQAIPSQADAGNLFHSSNRHLLGGNPFALLGYPVALVLYLVQAARPLGSEWLYTLLLSYLALRGFVGLE